MGNFPVVLISMSCTRSTKLVRIDLFMYFRDFDYTKLLTIIVCAVAGDVSLVPDVSVDLVVNTIEGT